MTTLDNFYGKATMNDGFSGSYLPDDVCFLLTRLDKVDVQSIDPVQKEALIQSGKCHYSQMLTLETPISDTHHAIYQHALTEYLPRTSAGIHRLAHTLYDIFKHQDKPLILVSLVRAGVPVGVLLKRAFSDPNASYHRPAIHYGISIIRDKGIDQLALAHITQKHPDCPIVFVDGWTGKGAIFGELKHSLTQFCKQYPHTKNQLFHQDCDVIPLVVLSDPAGVAWLSDGTDDWLIPSSLLNSTISGLVSRTLYRTGEFHGCVYYDEFTHIDESLRFVNQVDAHRQTLGKACLLPTQSSPRFATRSLIDNIAKVFAIDNINRIKPTIAEATRAIMRRQPQCVLIDTNSQHSADTSLLRHLCEQKHIPILYQDIYPYQAITIIQKRS